MKNFKLSRRRFLRGVLGGGAIALGLPPLEAMFDVNGVAYANDSGFPLRFGLFFWGNGVIPENWIPNGEGADYEMSEQLAALEPIRNKLAVITGMEVKTINSDPHMSGPAGLLTGTDVLKRGESETFAWASLDQVMAQEIGGDTRYRSLEVGVQPGVEGLSFSGPDLRNIPIYDPAQLFERLFGEGFRAPGDEPIIDPTLSLRRSVLDSVMDDADNLRSQLGVADQQRLEQHFESIRDLELRIARLEEDPPNLAACVRPDAPAAYPDVEGRPQMLERSRAITDLVTMAFACDATRVLSYWYSHPVSNVLFPNASAGHHQLTHDELGDQPQVNEIVKAIVGDFSYFLQSLDAIPEGDGTLLDNSIILGTTDVSYGRTHQIDEYPILIGGTGAGRFRTGFHYRSNRENTSLLSFSLLRAMGVSVNSFGDGAGYVEQGFSEIEV